MDYLFDASESGFGQVTYVRLVIVAGKIQCNLVIVKSRVALINYNSIPRLELAAAVLTTKVSELVKK